MDLVLGKKPGSTVVRVRSPVVTASHFYGHLSQEESFKGGRTRTNPLLLNPSILEKEGMSPSGRMLESLEKVA